MIAGGSLGWKDFCLNNGTGLGWPVNLTAGYLGITLSEPNPKMLLFKNAVWAIESQSCVDNTVHAGELCTVMRVLSRNAECSASSV